MFKAKKGKLEHTNTHPSSPNSPKLEALEDLAQTSLILPKQDHSSNVGPFFRTTHPGKPNNAQARCHLSQVQLC